MKPLLINTTPQFQSGYSIKTYDQSLFALPYHMHERYEITWIKEGIGSRIIGDNVSFFEAGDVLLLGPMLPHQWQSSPIDENQRAKSISLFFETDFPSRDLWLLEDCKPMHNILQLSHRGLRLRGSLKKNIPRKLQKLTRLSGARGMILLLEILQDISEQQEFDILASEGYVCRKNLDTDRINKITNYIFENLEQKITLESLGEIVNLHPNSLAREFKKATGFSIIEYINKVRIGKATRLLTETNKTIIDICYECGFQNLSHFNRYFKKTKHCTPSSFRKSLS